MCVVSPAAPRVPLRISRPPPPPLGGAAATAIAAAVGNEENCPTCPIVSGVMIFSTAVDRTGVASVTAAAAASASCAPAMMSDFARYRCC